MPSVDDDDDAAGLLTHKARFVHLIVCGSRVFVKESHRPCENARGTWL